MFLKKITLLSFLVLFASTVHAEFKLNKYIEYIGLSYGYVISGKIKSFSEIDLPTKEKLANSVAYGVCIGKSINSVFRVELEVNHKHKYNFTGTDVGRLESVNIYNTTAFVNAFYEHSIFKRDDSPKVFGMMGIGGSRNKFLDYRYDVSGTKYKASDNHNYDFAWALGIGFNNSLNSSTTIDVALKYIDRGQVNGPKSVTVIKGLATDIPKVNSKRPIRDITLAGTVRFKL